jgi:hypothetical protein
MDVPAKTEPQWTDIVTGRKTYNLKFLAAKILLGRLMRTLGPDPSQDSVREGVEQLHDLYVKNSASPSVQLDLKTIFR